jgi:hypothetical protein
MIKFGTLLLLIITKDFPHKKLAIVKVNQHLKSILSQDQQSLRSALLKLRKTSNYLRICSSHGFEAAEKFKLSDLDINDEAMDKLYQVR